MANVKRDMSSQVWLCVMNSFRVEDFDGKRRRRRRKRISLQEVICAEAEGVKTSGSSQARGS